MNKVTIQLGVGIVFLTLLLHPIVFTTVTNFLFVGIIPGTDIMAPFWVMGVFYLLSCLALITYLAYQPLYIGDMKHQEKVARQLARKKVLRHTSTRRQTTVNDQPAKASYKTATTSTEG